MNKKHRYLLALLCITTTTLISSSMAKKSERSGSDRLLCPKDEERACVECFCDPESGFNDCKPNKCPEAINREEDAKYAKADGHCQFGKIFKAECTLCSCTGIKDRCTLCAALPVKRPTQTEEVNEKLRWINDNRFFNYEINGWEKQQQWIGD